jgi:hypothetical protein
VIAEFDIRGVILIIGWRTRWSWSERVCGLYPWLLWFALCEGCVSMCRLTTRTKREIRYIAVKLVMFVSRVKVDLVIQSFGDCVHIHRQGLMWWENCLSIFSETMGSPLSCVSSTEKSLLHTDVKL